jgi:hypothetical protein
VGQDRWNHGWGAALTGANFGVVTQFEFRLNPVGPEILGGPIASRAQRMISAWVTITTRPESWAACTSSGRGGAKPRWIPAKTVRASAAW